MRPRGLLVTVLLVAALTGCTATDPAVSERPTADPTPADTALEPTATPTPSPTAEPAEVTFTFTCGYYAADGMAKPIDGEFASFAASWAHEPATTYCLPTKHGSVWTERQREAVALAGEVLPNGIEQVGDLYAQCAIRDNGYLRETSLAPNQAADVRAFLHLCPERPGADRLRALLAG